MVVLLMWLAEKQRSQRESEEWSGMTRKPSLNLIVFCPARQIWLNDLTGKSGSEIVRFWAFCCQIFPD